MTSIWVAEHGWVLPERDHRLLHPRDRRLGAQLRCRADEAIAVDRDSRRRARHPARELTLGTDNGSAFTARRIRLVLSGLGIATAAAATATPRARRSSNPGSGTSRNAGLAQRVRDPRPGPGGIAGYVDRYHHRPHSRLNYRTPPEVARTWEDHQEHYKTSGLNCQHPRGALQCCGPTPPPSPTILPIEV